MEIQQTCKHVTRHDLNLTTQNADESARKRSSVALKTSQVNLQLFSKSPNSSRAASLNHAVTGFIVSSHETVEYSEHLRSCPC